MNMSERLTNVACRLQPIMQPAEPPRRRDIDWSLLATT
mgnify:CR=1 FL=1